jgi:hypothetical protein
MDPAQPIDESADAEPTSEVSVGRPDVVVERGRRRLHDWLRRHWFVWVRSTLWTVMTIGLTLDNRDDLATYIPGDPGDSYLVLALLQWGADSRSSPAAETPWRTRRRSSC